MQDFKSGCALQRVKTCRRRDPNLSSKTTPQLSSNHPAIIEAVPNFSEGRDQHIIDAIAEAGASVSGARVLDVDSSPAANRTVITIAGGPEAVQEAAFRAIATAARLIDMRAQAGVHPRIGATDVCPLVPLSGFTMEETDALAQALGQRVGAALDIPVYLYEHSQPQAHRRALPHIRKGYYEGFAEKMRQEGWQPDYGPATFNAATGATVVGARDVLVAFNISLATQDVALANSIARRLRSAGSAGPDALLATRAIGWYMADYSQAQVSFNLLDYRTTSPLAAFEACRLLALESGVEIAGSELIGLMPEACVLEAGACGLQDAAGNSREALALAGVEHLMLDKLKPFSLRGKILEYALEDAGMKDKG